jgi:hypothetical protein
MMASELPPPKAVASESQADVRTGSLRGLLICAKGVTVKFMKIFLAVLSVAFLAIQFIRPTKNVSGEPPGGGIEHRFAVPAHVMQVLRRSCYDCHSDSTVYPWYARIQPVGWWLSGHIEKARRQLDFDQFATYRPARQHLKFDNIIDQIQQDAMPLPSYLIMHRDARLTPGEKEEVIRWCQAMMDSMHASSPPDSLQRRRAKSRQLW